jgi:hypothetical protein
MVDHLRLAIHPVFGKSRNYHSDCWTRLGGRDQAGGATAVAALGPHERSISGRCSPVASCGPGWPSLGHRASPRGSCRSWATTAAANVPTEPSSCSRAARALAPRSRPVAVDEDRVLRHVASWHRCGFAPIARTGASAGAGRHQRPSSWLGSLVRSPGQRPSGSDDYGQDW